MVTVTVKKKSTRSVTPATRSSCGSWIADVKVALVGGSNSGSVTPEPSPEPSGVILLADAYGALLKTADGYYLAVKA